MTTYYNQYADSFRALQDTVARVHLTSHNLLVHVCDTASSGFFPVKEWSAYQASCLEAASKASEDLSRLAESCASSLKILSDIHRNSSNDLYQ